MLDILSTELLRCVHTSDDGQRPTSAEIVERVETIPTYASIMGNSCNRRVYLKGFSEMSKPNNCLYIHF